MGEDLSVVPVERIERSILLLRGEKVILDSDIAALYGVETKTLVRSMKRNLDRFPSDFMFQLTLEEVDILRYQIGTRAFVRLRQVMSTRSDLIRRLDELEQRYDSQFKAVFDALRQLMAPPGAPSRRIGFKAT
jgi:hypothetical protein